MDRFTFEKTVPKTFRLLADGNKVRRHGSVDPAIFLERRVEDTTRPASLAWFFAST